MEYEFDIAKGSRIKKSDAEPIGLELLKIKNKKGGVATARDVLNAAKKKGSVMHRYFEWDDTKAAEMHRLEIARSILRGITIKVYESDESTGESVRLFHNVGPIILKEVDSTEELKSYAALPEILSDEKYKANVIFQAKQELESWSRKYDQYVRLFNDADFASVVNAIKKIVREMAY